MDEYLNFARQVLKILDIKFSETEELNELILKIRFAIILPGSTTEGEIMVITKQIADDLENRVTTTKLKKLLADLEDKISYLLFD